MATLAELLADNPEAKAEYDVALKAHGKEQFAAGETAGKEEIQGTIKAVAPYLNSDDYPEVIGETALKVLNSEESIITLKASVAAVDAVKEKDNTDNASDETDADGETNGQGGQMTDAEKAEESFQARMKKTGRA